jgi:Mrp family chromosome partitioning ATPase
MNVLRSGATALCLALVAAAPADPLGDSVTKLISATQIPGMQVLVVDNGRVTASRSYGVTNQFTAAALHRALAAAAAKPAAGEDPKVTARLKRVWDAFRSGRPDRSELSASLNAELTPAVLAQTTKQFKALGAPTAWTYVGKTVKGGMTVYAYRVKFATGTTRTLTMSVEAHGKITDLSM